MTSSSIKPIEAIVEDGDEDDSGDEKDSKPSIMSK